jgi:hypothetical protein
MTEAVGTPRKPPVRSGWGTLTGTEGSRERSGHSGNRVTDTNPRQGVSV